VVVYASTALYLLSVRGYAGAVGQIHFDSAPRGVRRARDHGERVRHDGAVRVRHMAAHGDAFFPHKLVIPTGTEGALMGLMARRALAAGLVAVAAMACGGIRAGQVAPDADTGGGQNDAGHSADAKTNEDGACTVNAECPAPAQGGISCCFDGRCAVGSQTADSPCSIVEPDPGPAGSAACVAAGGQCVLPRGEPCTLVGPEQACSPDQVGGTFCCAVAPDASCPGGGIKASSYDQTCVTDTDCVAITSGDSCNVCGFKCTNAAINVGAQAKYSMDIDYTTGSLTSQRMACTGDCTLQFGPCCIGGTCQLGGQCPAPGVLVRDAAAETGVDGAADGGADAATESGSADASGE
jgi:hypothetical protein